jgi:4-amino-4-deoxy-L-arabinose transferase-like glycosyltransferase
LQKAPIYIWDEARLAWNAIEMSKNNNFIVTFFEGKPDEWNTKPPLMIILQSLSINILGINELSIRLPSAIAALITCLFLFFYLKRQTSQLVLGLFASLILVTAQGYINIHCSRTGDYDSLLIMFTTMFCFYFFDFITTRKLNSLKFFFLFLTLAVLTKGIQPLIFIPGLLILLFIINRDNHEKYQVKHIIFYGALSAVTIAGYYLYRELLNPGFLKIVLKNEIGGRYLNTIEGHNHPIDYYFKLIREKQFGYWFFPMLLGIFIGIFNKNKKFKQLSVFCVILSVFYLLVISFSQTKLEWYDLPVFPFMAVLGAIAVNELFLLLKQIPQLKERLTVNVVPYLVVILIFLFPYQAIIDKVYFPKSTDPLNESIPLMLKELPANKLTYVICWDNGYGPQINFYIEVLANKGITCYYKYYKDLEPGDIAIACQDFEKNYIETEYKNTILLEKNAAKMYKIEARN